MLQVLSSDNLNMIGERNLEIYNILIQIEQELREYMTMMF